MQSAYKYKISNIGVVYEDPWFLILDKPPGLLTISGPKEESRTLTRILNADLEKRIVSYRLHPCHRLDKETSGLIIYAKGKSAQEKMMEEFRERRVTKTYIAFIQGTLPKNQGEIKVSLEGLSAVTQYKVLARRRDFSILEVKPLSGRTNQIRIHFKAIGHPLVGETKFAFRRDYRLKAKRACLHAKSLEFIHPFSKKKARVDSELAVDLKLFLKVNNN